MKRARRGEYEDGNGNENENERVPLFSVDILPVLLNNEYLENIVKFKTIRAVDKICQKWMPLPPPPPLAIMDLSKKIPTEIIFGHSLWRFDKFIETFSSVHAHYIINTAYTNWKHNYFDDSNSNSNSNSDFEFDYPLTPLPSLEDTKVLIDEKRIRCGRCLQHITWPTFGMYDGKPPPHRMYFVLTPSLTHSHRILVCNLCIPKALNPEIYYGKLAIITF